MKASAKAHPIQGLIKYHGLKDPVRHIPFHDSISVCTAPLFSHTTVEVLESGDHSFEIDGEAATGRAHDRMCAVVEAIQEHADDDRACRVVSKNSFPQFVGLGSSSSGFAALTVAAAAAYGFDATLERLSEIARLGAGSACRSVTGGVSAWLTEGARSYSKCLLRPGEVDWRIVVPLVQHEEPTENVHAEVVTSPLFEARVASMAKENLAMQEALEAGDLSRIGALAERDTMSLHAVTMTGDRGHLTWQPATVAVMQTVKRLRSEGVPVWFSIDTGATAYLNTDSAHEQQVADAVRGIEGVADVLHLEVGGPAHLVDDHLF